MALNYDRTAIENLGELHESGREFSITNGLEWELMGIGIPNITAENHEDVYRRISFQNRVYGGSVLREDDGKPYFFTAADVQRRIGLKTNVRTKTEAEFLEDVYSEWTGNDQ